MKRLWTTLALSAMAFAVRPAVAQAQPTKQTPRLCFLTFDPSTLRSNRFKAFFDGLRQQGYVDGKTIVIDYLSVDGKADRYPVNAAECVRRKADIIAVSTTPAAQAAKKATRAIPIVMLGLGDPVAAGLVDDLARPGGNVTGLTFIAGPLAAKRLELLKEVAPSVSRVLMLTHSPDPISGPQIQMSTRAAQSLGITLLIRDVQTPDDLTPAFKFGADERADALVTTAESIFTVHRARIIELAAAQKLPAVYGLSLAVPDGGLMSYTADLPALHARAAIFVDRILKGAKPADLPVEQPTQFDLAINLRTAKTLGIRVPQSLLLRADRVIE